MQRAIIFALLLFFPTVLNVRVIKWEGKPLSVSISTERLTRIEFPENLRSVFLSRSDIAVEKETDRSHPGVSAADTMELPLLDARLHRCRTLPPESVARIS